MEFNEIIEIDNLMKDLTENTFEVDELHKKIVELF